MRRASIKTKLYALIFLILIPVVLLNVVSIKTNFERSVDAELNASEDFAEAFSMSFVHYLDKLWSDQYTMGVAIHANPRWTYQDIEKYMNQILEGNKDILDYSWVSLEGRILVSTQKEMVGRSIRERGYYKRLMKGEEMVISDLTPSMRNNTTILPVARRVMINGEAIGIMVSIVDVNQLSRIFLIKRDDKTSEYGLVDSSGMLVYINGNLDTSFEKRRLKNDSPAWRALNGEVIKTKARISEFDGSQRMGVDYPIPQIGWECFVTTSVTELLEKYQKDMERGILVLLTVTICSFIIAWVLGSRFIKSISKLKQAAEEVAKGNYTYKTSLSGRDELAATSQAFNEMTEQVNTRLYEAEEYSRLKSQFFSTISHELKTPLNVILASTQLMEKLDKSDAELYFSKVQRHLGILKQNSLRLLRLISNLIDLNKLEVSHLTITKKNMDIVRVVEDISLSIVEYTKQKNIELIFDTELEEKIIAFDPDMIERIMLNLLSNAIKFTGEGGSIEVNIYDRHATIAISVRDTGIGIPYEMQEKIFDCFTQVDGSLQKKIEGSGIGLSLVKSLVELHDGTISLISELGYGSEFTIELPNVLNEDEEMVLPEASIANVERIKVEFSDIYI